MARGRPPLDAAEALCLPPVTEDHLDRVIHAAGTKPLQAIAVLVSAIGWYLARSVAPHAVPRFVEGVVLSAVRAARLHDDAAGQG